MLLATDLRNTVLAELTPGAMNRLAYTPYGFQSAQRPVGSSLGFNGELRGAPTDWYHLGNGHRVYNLVLMRFHSPDTLSPFGKGGLNPYAYCKGDPINLTDPTGQIPEWLMPVAVITVAVLLASYNISLVATNRLTGPALGVAPSAKAKMVTRIPIGAARIATVSAAVSAGGAVVQWASDDSKVKEVGMYLSLSALAMGASATGLRFGVNVWKLRKSNHPYLLNNTFRAFVGMRLKTKSVPPSRAGSIRSGSPEMEVENTRL